MKIYPSKHKIKQVLEANVDKDIVVPLAYINTEYSKYNIEKTIENDFLLNTKKIVIPNQQLENEDVLLFDEFGNIANSATVINRVEDKYYYYPNNMIEFTPLWFEYNLIARKKQGYNITDKYNINISCVDDKNLEFANSLAKILVAPSEKNFLPNNIIINNNNTKMDSLIDKDITNKDIVFFQSYDGQHYDFVIEEEYDDGGVSTLLPYESLMSSNTNMWIVSNSHWQFPISDLTTAMPVNIKRPMITKDNKVEIMQYYNTTDPAFNNLTIHNLFDSDVCPILIIEQLGRGFIILSGCELFMSENIEKYKNIIYETIMYVYCNSYKTSTTVREPISFTVPDYEIINNSLCKKNKFVSKQNINDILRFGHNDYYIYSVDIIDSNENLPVPEGDLVSTVDNIIFEGFSNNRAVFSMNPALKDTSVYKEPPKPDGWKSIMYNNKIYYIEEIHYLMETSIEDKFFLTEKDTEVVVRLYPIKSSKYGLDINKDLMTKIPLLMTTENGIEKIIDESYICYIDTDDNSLFVIAENEFEQLENRIIISTIKIKKTYNNTYITDMRLRGGGLPEDMPDNFNLLDIGHIYGRPYRQANTLIITLPKRYEQYKQEILDVINKYRVAEDYPILFFEDEEGDGEY